VAIQLTRLVIFFLLTASSQVVHVLCSDSITAPIDTSFDFNTTNRKLNDQLLARAVHSHPNDFFCVWLFLPGLPLEVE
jgi:hypothetical protein